MKAASLVSIPIVLLLVSGCQPTTYEGCRAEAAKMPTDKGVSVAISDCTKKFITEPAEKKAKVEAEAEERKNKAEAEAEERRMKIKWDKLDLATKNEIQRLSSAWQEIINSRLHRTLNSVKAKMGEPSASEDTEWCNTPFNYSDPIDKSPTNICRWHEWRSLKPTEKCTQRDSGSYFYKKEPEPAHEVEPVYRAKVNEASGALVTLTMDAVANCN